ncbi:MAG: hypothetical protein HY882_00720 [Deltaproteobacteria bacterium]|nr:hypothetical protein [Deltaproteobacteria bacterium]
MGRTVLPFSQVLEREYEEWKKFRRALRKEDQEAFDRLFDRAKLHVQAAAYTSHPWPLESILLSICLEHEKLLWEILGKLKGVSADPAGDKKEIMKSETNSKS